MDGAMFATTLGGMLGVFGGCSLLLERVYAHTSVLAKFLGVLCIATGALVISAVLLGGA